MACLLLIRWQWRCVPRKFAVGEQDSVFVALANRVEVGSLRGFLVTDALRAAVGALRDA